MTIQKLKADIAKLERDRDLKELASKKLSESLAKQVEISLLQENANLYMVNGNKNWSLLRKHVFDRKQRVVIEGQSSNWQSINAGVPQGSVLGPLLFLIYINDITENLQSDCFLYAEDTSIFDIVESPTMSSMKLNNDPISIMDCASQWLVTINPTKTESIIFSNKWIKPYHSYLFYEGKKIAEVTQHDHLGLTLSSTLSWKAHILRIYEKACRRLNLLKGLKYKLNRGTLKKLYLFLVRPMMEYADVLWVGCTDGESDLLKFVQYESAKIVTGAIKGTSRHYLMKDLGWEDMKLRCIIHKLMFYYKIVNNFVPNYLKELLPAQTFERTHYSSRTHSDFTLFPVRTEHSKKPFFPCATNLWNGLDTSVRNLRSVTC